jgi:hypothetical protein
MAGALTPITRWLLTNDGVFSPGAKLYTYASGTSTPLAAYTDAALAVPHANPIVADAEGVLPVVFLGAAAYRFLVTDAAGATIFPAQDDITASTLSVADDSITYAKLQNVSATQRILARKSALAGNVEEATLSEVLDFIGSAVQGDLLYRGAASWTRLGAGTSGQFLQTLGTGANPAWANTGSIDRDVTALDVNTTTAETTVYSYAVPGGTLGSTRMVRLTLIGDLLQNFAGSDSLAVRVKYGATTFFTGSFTVAQHADRKSFRLVAEVSGLNATNAQITHALMTLGGTSSGTGAPAAGAAISDGSVAIAEDSTASKNLVVTVQLGTSNALISFRCHAVHTELV